jgi:hypothetical protein
LIGYPYRSLVAGCSVETILRVVRNWARNSFRIGARQDSSTVTAQFVVAGRRKGARFTLRLKYRWSATSLVKVVDEVSEVFRVPRIVAKIGISVVSQVGWGTKPFAIDANKPHVLTRSSACRCHLHFEFEGASLRWRCLDYSD